MDFAHSADAGKEGRFGDASRVRVWRAFFLFVYLGLLFPFFREEIQIAIVVCCLADAAFSVLHF